MILKMLGALLFALSLSSAAFATTTIDGNAADTFELGATLNLACDIQVTTPGTTPVALTSGNGDFTGESGIFSVNASCPVQVTISCASGYGTAPVCQFKHSSGGSLSSDIIENASVGFTLATGATTQNLGSGGVTNGDTFKVAFSATPDANPAENKAGEYSTAIVLTFSENP